MLIGDLFAAVRMSFPGTSRLLSGRFVMSEVGGRTDLAVSSATQDGPALRRQRTRYLSRANSGRMVVRAATNG